MEVTNTKDNHLFSPQTLLALHLIGKPSAELELTYQATFFSLFSLHPLHVFHLQSLLSKNGKGVQGCLHNARQISQANSSRFSAANVAALRHFYWETAARDFAHVVTVMCCKSEAE